MDFEPKQIFEKVREATSSIDTRRVIKFFIVVTPMLLAACGESSIRPQDLIKPQASVPTLEPGAYPTDIPFPVMPQIVYTQTPTPTSIPAPALTLVPTTHQERS